MFYGPEIFGILEFQILIEGFVMLPTLNHVFGVDEGLCSFIQMQERDTGWIISDGFLLEHAARMEGPGIVILFEWEALLRSQHDFWEK